MKITKVLFPIPALLVCFGCGNPADKVPEASVSAKTNAPAASAKPADAPAAKARTYVLGPENSTIAFIGSKVTGKHDGGFKQFAGELHVVDGKLADTGNKIVIQMDSIWADNDRLTGHLKTPDFFNVAQIPTATFETISITPGQTNSTITGNLTLHGVTKQISFPATIQVSDSAVDLNAEFFIKRMDFDVKYPGKPNDLVRNEVVLKLKVKAAPKA
jgi:polyisoprenoid-binding protein YceI